MNQKKGEIMSIINATPTVVDLGRNDKSTKDLPILEENRPTHLPKFWIWSEKGPTTPQFMSFSSAKALYGESTFDPLKKWYNHATHFAAGVMGEGNNVILERVVPTDASTGSLVLWCEIATGQTITLYQRDPNTGKYIKDNLGNNIPVSPPQTVQGNKIRWFLAQNPNPVSGFGTLSSTVGTGISGSTAYPVLEMRAASHGEFINSIGLMLRPATASTVDVDFVKNTGSFPYDITFKKNIDAYIVTIPNKYGGADTQVTLNDVPDPDTLENINILDKLISSYSNTEDPKYPLRYFDVGDVYIYESNITTIASAIRSAEETAVSSLSAPIYNPSWYDDATTDLGYNIFTARSIKQAPYIATIVDNSYNNTVTFLGSELVYFSNGSDGTINESNFNALVAVRASEYGDPNTKVQDNALNPESIFYDSGFSMDTKKALINTISIRKDTFLILSTYISNNPASDVASDMATGQALQTELSKVPDSDVFGTAVFRAMIVMQSGITRNHIYTKRIPLSYDLAIKSAKYMGASNRRWKDNQTFGMAPGNIITSMYKIEPDFVSQPTQLLLWDKNIIWSQPFDRGRYFFPTQQTVYDDETSILNNYISAMAAVEVDKVGWEAWRNFSGISGATDNQLKAMIEKYVNNRLTGVFGDAIKFKPRVEFKPEQ